MARTFGGRQRELQYEAGNTEKVRGLASSPKAEAPDVVAVVAAATVAVVAVAVDAVAVVAAVSVVAAVAVAVAGSRDQGAAKHLPCASDTFTAI